MLHVIRPAGGKGRSATQFSRFIVVIETPGTNWKKMFLI
jgi:hypothetical protein